MTRKPARPRTVPNQSILVPALAEANGVDALALLEMFVPSKSVSTPITHSGATCQLKPAWPPPRNPLELSDVFPVTPAIVLE